MSKKSGLFKTLSNTISIIHSIYKDIAAFMHNLKEDIFSTREKVKDLYKTNYELGLYHLNALNYGDAIFRFKMLKLFYANKVSAEIDYYIGYCYVAKYDYYHGIKHLQTYLKNTPSAQFRDEAQFLISLSTNSVPFDSRIPLTIVQRMFDPIACEYDKLYINIDNVNSPYHIIPLMLKSYIEERGNNFNNNILDIGCGTGYIGAECRKLRFVNALVGIDISQKMLEMAAKREFEGSRVYSDLINYDIETYFVKKLCSKKETKSRNHKYDIVIISDMLQYYGGNVNSIFHLAHKISNTDAVLCISTCIMPQSNTQQQDHIHQNTLQQWIVSDFSYSHQCFLFSKAYLIDTAYRNNWIVVCKKDFHYPNNLNGLVLLFKKQGNDINMKNMNKEYE